MCKFRFASFVSKCCFFLHMKALSSVFNKFPFYLLFLCSTLTIDLWLNLLKCLEAMLKDHNGNKNLLFSVSSLMQGALSQSVYIYIYIYQKKYSVNCICLCIPSKPKTNLSIYNTYWSKLCKVISKKVCHKIHIMLVHLKTRRNL